MLARFSSLLIRSLLAASLACGLPASVACAQDAKVAKVAPDGTITFPSIDVPSSPIMSTEGNMSRVEHIMTERSLKGQPIAAFNAGSFGPWLERTKAAYAVTIRSDRIGGVPVLVYEPTAGVARAARGKVLINIHGGGFVGCFTECGGLESIPIAALTGMRVISVDYRLAPAARFPAGSEDVAAVYAEVLKTVPAKRIGIYGCSAGGLLTAQSLAWFQSHKLPAPAAAGIFCAGGDPGMSGDSRIVGTVLGDGEVPGPPRDGPPLGYMLGASADDSNAYPARNPAVLKRFPPTLVISGTRDFALSSAINLHSKLVANGVDARLHVWEGGRHAFFYDSRVPESREVYRVVADFFNQRLR